MLHHIASHLNIFQQLQTSKTWSPIHHWYPASQHDVVRKIRLRLLDLRADLGSFLLGDLQPVHDVDQLLEVLTCRDDAMPRINNDLMVSTVHYSTLLYRSIHETNYLYISISIYIYVYIHIYITLFLYIHVCKSLYIYSIYQSWIDRLSKQTIKLSNYLSIYLSIYLYIYISIYLSIHLSIYPSIHPSIYLSICLFIYLSYYI